jgi:hypothetical protein
LILSFRPRISAGESRESCTGTPKRAAAEES